jgi:hypothetical protein
MRGRVVGLLLLSAMLLNAEESLSHGRRFWHWSMAVLAAANAADVASSVGHYELNPVLGSGRFGMRSAGIKIGISAATLGVEYLIVRRHPEAMRKTAYVNIGLAGVTAGIAAGNFLYESPTGATARVAGVAQSR